MVRAGILVEQAVAPIPGGTGRYSVELARALARTAAEADTVTGWITWHRNVDAATIPGVAGPRRLTLPRRPTIALWQRGLGPRPSADVVHAPTLLVPPRPRHGRLVVTIHDAVPWTHPETLTTRGVRFHRDMAARAVAEADAITVPTAAVATELQRHVAGLEASRVVVAPGGVTDVIRRAPTAAEESAILARLGLPDRFVLSLATVEPRKGLDVLLRAMAQAPAAECGLALVIVGQPGWGGIDIAETVEGMRLPPERVRLLGRRSDAELAVILRRATMLCAPSLAEGFGLPVVEAMAVGTPVICSDDPAQVEVAGDAAVVVPRGDDAALSRAIAELASDQTARAALAAAGLRRSSSFDWDTTGRQMWQLYHALD